MGKKLCEYTLSGPENNDGPFQNLGGTDLNCREPADQNQVRQGAVHGRKHKAASRTGPVLREHREAAPRRNSQGEAGFRRKMVF